MQCLCIALISLSILSTLFIIDIRYTNSDSRQCLYSRDTATKRFKLDLANNLYISFSFPLHQKNNCIVIIIIIIHEFHVWCSVTEFVHRVRIWGVNFWSNALSNMSWGIILQVTFKLRCYKIFRFNMNISICIIKNVFKHSIMYDHSNLYLLSSNLWMPCFFIFFV